MKSIKTAALLAAFAAAFFATPARAQTEAQLLGNWTCEMNDPALSLSITTTYMSGGAFISEGVSSAQSPNGQIDLHIVVAGEWSLRGDQLTETGRDVAIFSASLGGTAITPDNPTYGLLLNQITSGAVQPNVRTLVSLTPEAYTITYQGYRQTCNRRR